MGLYIATYIVIMVTVTTIQISSELKEALKMRKIHAKESYEEIIWDLLEDQMELKEEVIKRIEAGLKEYEEGKYFTMEEVFGENKGDK